MNLKIFDTPGGLYQSIPTDLYENIEFRKELHTILDKDERLQELFLQLCLADPKIWFNSVVWTADPRQKPGLRNWPFILRKPKQEIVVDTLKKCIDGGKDMGINKSRDEGATELVTKFIALYCLIPDSYYIVGSRNKDLVDCGGDPYTLFAKIDYAFNLPYKWFKPIRASIERKDMQLTLGWSGSVIKGETTNESFAAGRRATAMFLDEFGRVEPRPALSIEGSIHDVTDCVIYGSTHWFGEHHPFNEALKRKTTEVVELPWFDNPNKAKGLYRSPDYNQIEIIDRAYYESEYPEVNFPVGRFVYSDYLKTNQEAGLSDVPTFVADACESLPGDVRAPWHDREEEKRRGNKRDFMSNIWMSPVGASDAVFESTVLHRIKSNFIRPARHMGEVTYELNKKGYVRNPVFHAGGKCRLKWWEGLVDGRPDQFHNYVIGCDISLGTGNSNSTVCIMDVNQREIVGTWVCPNTTPENFADQVVALARWIGGYNGEPFIVFENNGGHGVNFGRRVRWQGHMRMYIQRTEDKRTKKNQNRYGWNSTPNSKSDLLGSLGIALSEGLKKFTTYDALTLHDVDLLEELYDYVYYENGDIGASEVADQSSGARKRHGDRVIAAALCVLGAKYQHRAKPTAKTQMPMDSYAFRKQQAKKNQKKKKTPNNFIDFKHF